MTGPLNGSDSTLLKISGVGMSPYAARGLTQTLNPIEQAKDLRRTINGELIDFSVEQFRKYASVISGNDQMPPGVAGVWPGRGRPGRMRRRALLPHRGRKRRAARGGGLGAHRGSVHLLPTGAEMRVVDFSQSFDEWDAQVSWSLTLEEI